MNNWNIRKLAIVESDDTEDRYDRNGLNYLFYWKAKYSKFKISLFTIPNRTSKEMLDLLMPHMVYQGKREPWIELLIHGFNHSSNFECYGWDYETTKKLLEPVVNKKDTQYQKPYYKKIFKAPGWTITPDLCGYPANENDPIVKDKQAVYKALNDMDFVITDRHYNKPARLENGKYICIDCNPDIVHFHTWDMIGENRNGYRQIIEEHGEPWNQETEFEFLSDAWKEGLIKPCQ